MSLEHFPDFQMFLVCFVYTVYTAETGGRVKLTQLAGQSPATGPKHDDISQLGRIYDIITEA